MTNNIHNPRETLTHDVQVGQVYGNKRTKTEHSDGSVSYDELFRVVYADDERIALRSNMTIQQGELRGNHHYRLEPRDTFEKNASEGMYRLVEDVDGAPPMASDGIVTLLQIVKRHRDKYRHNVNCGGGRKEKHKLEAIDELLEEVEMLNPTEIDWETVSGVGAKTAQNLRDAGIRTDADVLATSDEQLLAIGGVGKSNLEKLRERAEGS